METISIIDSKDYVDQKVKIGVWLTNKRSSGKIAFLQLRDGTAYFQGVVVKSNVSVSNGVYAGGLPVKPVVNVVVNGVTLKEGQDYDLDVSSNTDVANATRLKTLK